MANDTEGNEHGRCAADAVVLGHLGAEAGLYIELDIRRSEFKIDKRLHKGEQVVLYVGAIAGNVVDQVGIVDRLEVVIFMYGKAETCREGYLIVAEAQRRLDEVAMVTGVVIVVEAAYAPSFQLTVGIAGIDLYLAAAAEGAEIAGPDLEAVPVEFTAHILLGQERARLLFNIAVEGGTVRGDDPEVIGRGKGNIESRAENAALGVATVDIVGLWFERKGSLTLQRFGKSRGIGSFGEIHLLLAGEQEQGQGKQKQHVVFLHKKEDS